MKHTIYIEVPVETKPKVKGFYTVISKDDEEPNGYPSVDFYDNVNGFHSSQETVNKYLFWLDKRVIEIPDDGEIEDRYPITFGECLDEGNIKKNIENMQLIKAVQWIKDLIVKQLK